MISIETAREKVLSAATALPAQNVPLSEALDRVLADDVRADVDSPPHDKALMDGFAVVAEDVQEGAELEVVEQITAGETPSRTITRGLAARIMTGAPVPTGATAVIMVERTEFREGANHVRILQSAARPGENIMRRGEVMRREQVVVPRGRRVRPMEIGLLAEVGRVMVAVHPAPRVALLATGNELVDAAQIPRPGQIRNSNGPMLAALARRAGAKVDDLGIARDVQVDLQRAVRTGLEADVLILSGGVSAGVLDLTPRVLSEEGVEQVFHHVQLKPGKPLWFGAAQRGGHHVLVFGLPGNPVSGLVCFELFVRPALEKLAGRCDGTPSRRGMARLEQAFAHRGERPTCFPASLTMRDGEWWIRPLNWKGSADLRTLADAQALILFPGGDRRYAEGEQVAFQWLD